MVLYVFDGMKVRKYEEPIDFKTLIHESKARSWLYENPLRNIYGQAPGWRNACDFDEILPMRADSVTPCYLPKDPRMIDHKSILI